MPFDIDYSSLHDREGGANRGMAAFGSVLDAVLQRRAAMQAEKQQREQAEAHFQANLAFQKNQAEMQEAARVRDDERASKIAEAQAEQQRLERERQDRIQQGSVIEKVGPMFATRGQEGLGLSYLQSQNIGIAPKPVDDSGLREPIPQPAENHLPFLPSPLEAVTGRAQAAAAAEQERQRKLAEAQAAARGVYTLDFGNGRTQDLNVRDMGPEGQAAQIDALIEAARTQAEKEALIRSRAQVQAGLTKVGEVGKAVVEPSVARDENNKAAMARALVGADAARSRRLETPPDVTARLKNQELENYLKEKGFSKGEAQLQQFRSMASVAKAADGKDGALAAQMFMGLYTKFAQGEVGVLNVNDIDTFWTKAGSPGDRTEAALARILTGQDGPKKRAAAMNAIDALASSVKAKLGGIETGAQILMEPYKEEGDRVLRAYFDGRGLPEYDKRRKAEKAQKAAADADAFLAPKKGAAK